MDDIIESIHAAVGLLDGVGDQMFQITLDFDSKSVQTIPADTLEDIRRDVLDLKIRVRSKETERAVIWPQDLHAINYVDEFGRFLQQQPMSEAQRPAVLARGTETLKAVLAEHPGGESE
jgi:hypothetical protein